MQTQESKIDTGKALDADLVDTESIRTDSTVQDDSSRSGNDTDADDADIRPILCRRATGRDLVINDMVHQSYLDAAKKRYKKEMGTQTLVAYSDENSNHYDDSETNPRTTIKHLGKLFDSCTSKVDSEPPHGSNVDIPHIHECKQTLDVSAGTSINVQKEQSLDLSADDDTEKWRQITSVLTPVHNVQ
ncbi:hypothetical protein Tco_1182020 [Tanacetum coccineum]